MNDTPAWTDEIDDGTSDLKTLLLQEGTKLDELITLLSHEGAQLDELNQIMGNSSKENSLGTLKKTLNSIANDVKFIPKINTILRGNQKKSHKE